MAREECISALGGWEWYELCVCRQKHHGEGGWCVLRLGRDRPRPAFSSGCWREASVLHDMDWRSVLDLLRFEYAVELEIPWVWVVCPHCGPKLELLGWLDSYSRVTKRLAESVSRLCAVMSLRRAADYLSGSARREACASTQ